MKSLDPANWSSRAQWLLALLLGAAGVLAYAPFELGLLMLPILALLLHLVRHAGTAGQAARLGYAFGLGLMGFGVSWLHISIAQFGGVSLSLAIVITLVFVLLMALYFALFGALARWFATSLGELSWMLLVAPSCWLLLEWLRGWLFSGFPWLSLGYSQLDLPLAGFAPLLGSYGVGWLLVVSAGSLNLWRRWWPPLLLLAVWAVGLGLSRVNWTSPAGDPVEVALVQGNVPQRDKWKPDRFGPSLQRYLRMSAQAPSAQLLVWPETAIAGFANNLEAGVLQPLSQRLEEQGRDLLTGIVAGDPRGDYYNAMISLGASGRHSYYKHHLVPFGEYLPLKSLLDPVLDFLHIPMSDFTAGDGEKRPIPLAGHPVGVDICYEDAFASEVRRALPEAHFLVNASNDAWFGDSLAPEQHLQIARMRALESGRPLLRATNTGVSAIVDAHGGIQVRAPQFDQAVLVGRIQPRQGETGYVRFGDAPLLTLAMLVLLLALWHRRRG